MIFYMVMTLTIVVLIFQIRYLLNSQNKSRHLYMLCQLRREMVAFLAESHSELAPKDYIIARELLTVCDISINKYKGYGHKIFNFRNFLEFFKQNYKTSNSLKSKTPSNESIVAFKTELNEIIILGFFLHTPFLRYEIGAKAFLVMLKMILVKWKNKKSDMYKKLEMISLSLSEHLNVRSHFNQRAVISF